MSKSWYYARPKLAKKIATQLSDDLFSRMLMLGPRRIGKTNFVLRELMPTLIEMDCIPVYASMWKNKNEPHLGLIQALEQATDAINQNRLKELLNTEVKKISALGLSLELAEKNPSRTKAAQPDLLRIENAITSLVARDKRIVLIIDEAQHIATNKNFESFHYALRSILDEVGDTISVLFTGSSRMGMQAMFTDEKAPFFNSATPMEFPLLDKEFVTFVVNKLDDGYDIKVDKDVLMSFFTNNQHSPFWLIRLARDIVMGENTFDESIEYVLMQQELELSPDKKLKGVSSLAKKLLFRISSELSLYSEDAVLWYQRNGEKNVTRSKIQSALNVLKQRELVSQVGKRLFIENPSLVNYVGKSYILV